MSSCENCPIYSFKKKYDSGEIVIIDSNGIRNDAAFNAFAQAMELFSKSKLNNDCSLGEDGCPAIYRREVQKL